MKHVIDISHVTRQNITPEIITALLDYNPETGLFVWVSGGKKGKVAGTVTPHGKYISICINELHYMAHRLAWLITHGKWPDVELDHIDRNPANNAIKNLREATISENKANSSPWRVTGRPRGVRKVSKSGYQVRIYKEYEHFYVGTFHTRDEAAHAYNKKAIELFGEFATLNPVGEPKPWEAIPASNKEQA